MNIEVTIKSPELAAAINALAAAMGNRQLQAPAEEAPAAPKEKPARSAKAKETTPPTPEPETDGDAGEKQIDTPTEQEPASSSNDESSDAVIEYAQIKKAVMDVSLAKGRDAAVALLAEFGAKKGDEVPEAKWPAFLARADEIKTEELA